MSEYVLETQNLGISFGGLKAVQNANIKIKKGQIYGMIGPNGTSPWGADALTVSPYLGDDSLQPFVDVANETTFGALT